jgi:succinate dehydrogenase/fumarate reductase cytochrome b subunit
MRVSISNLVRVQAIAGVAFAVFLTVHLANQLFAPAGAQAYDRAQGALRTLYQWPPFEVFVVAAGFVGHVASSLWLRRLRRNSVRVHRPWRHRLHTWSGMFLLVFATVQHIPAVRGSSLFFGTPPCFGGIALYLFWHPAY